MSLAQAPFRGLYQGKRVLVTGHTGFKGAWMCQWLLGLGAEVCGYSIDIPTKPSLFEELGLESRLHHHLGDIRDLERMRKVFAEFQPEIVFHMAAQPLVRASYDDPKSTFDTNVGGTVNVLECVRLTPSIEAAVFIATDKCYENVEWEYGYRETDPLGGKDPYSASKACAEIVFSAYQRSFFANSKVRLASARAGNVIGGGDWAVDRIVPDCMRAWSVGKPLTVRNPGSTRPWQHVLEPLGGYLWLGALLWGKKDGVVGESFNFGPLDLSTRTVGSLIDELTKSWQGQGWAHQPESGTLKKEAGVLRLSCDRAHTRLQWRAALSFEETVRMTAEWYRDFYSRKGDVTEQTQRQIEAYCRLAQQQNIAWTGAAT